MKEGLYNFNGGWSWSSNGSQRNSRKYGQPGFQNAPGAQQTSPKEDPIEVLGKLKQLLDAGLITEDDYNAKKQRY